MEAVLLLANSAEGSNGGMVSALGLGWSVTTSPTPPAALVLLLKVPWDQTNQKQHLVLDLVDGDGQPFTAPGSSAPLKIEGDLEAGRPAGIPAGTPIDQSMVVSLGPGMPLAKGNTYQWRLHVNGVIVTSRSFFVRPN